MLEVAETQARLQQITASDNVNVFCPDVPRYIISKLGLNKPTADTDGQFASAIYLFVSNKLDLLLRSWPLDSLSLLSATKRW